MVENDLLAALERLTTNADRQASLLRDAIEALRQRVPEPRRAAAAAVPSAEVVWSASGVPRRRKR
jgi:hypothetical protein